MAFINWKLGRWISIAVAVLTAVSLFGILSSSGFSLNDEFMGFQIKYILGAGNLLSAYILYKVL